MHSSGEDSGRIRDPNLLVSDRGEFEPGLEEEWEREVKKRPH